ncbi:AmmeMemoRadiSam system radical SAM enzyme [Candidatus Eisenbacteria bacterium]|uniref:AmmeMemoRadiSam system radical SAM enzyme n=1 Tax=Eiseniibacteriota bacterium TaxID=2212470 RepID=A0ABV6YPW5_UNCEI
MRGNRMQRREFIRTVCTGSCGIAASGILPARVLAAESPYEVEARYYTKLDDNWISCQVCPRGCAVADGKKGFCRVRTNREGKYYSSVYGRACTYHVDPIEKKPLFHFMPGTTAFSIATVGCNLDCKFCQNWEISQEHPENVDAYELKPAKVVEAAKQFDAPTIAYTYTEPIVWFEYALDCVRAGHDAGLRSVMVSAGYMNREPMVEVAGEMDAIKIDLKSISGDYYKDICSATLEPVLSTLATIKETGTWLEIVNLMVPTLNDSDEDVERLCKWVKENLGSDVPVHFTRFYPTYKLKNLPPTPVSTVEKAREIALANGINYPYVGNVPSGHPGESTYCPGCGEMVIKRVGYRVLSITLEDGKCPSCGIEIPGIWS